MTPEHVTHARAVAKHRKQAGMALASCRLDRQARILAGQIALLEAIRRDPERQATTDDIDADLLGKFRDGGKWRGSIPRGLALARLVRRVGHRSSDRAARHCGTVAVWKAIASDAVLDACRATLQRQLLALGATGLTTPPAQQTTLFDHCH
jgi:hypothetical protein